MGKKAREKQERRTETTSEKEWDFNVPEFDERAFIEREIGAAKITYIVVLLGAGVGVLARLLAEFADAWKTGFLALLAGIALLPVILRAAGAPEAVKDKKGLAGNLFLLLFTWLAFWVLASNPPFA
ncbi:MAG: hypothetical protein ACT4PT_11370 [Methanobacteriota archaeon]